MPKKEKPIFVRPVSDMSICLKFYKVCKKEAANWYKYNIFLLSKKEKKEEIKIMKLINPMVDLCLAQQTHKDLKETIKAESD